MPRGMTVKEAASRLGVGRPALSNLLNGNSSLSPEMAVRLEKSFGADRQKLLDMQAEADRSKQRASEKVVAVRRYVPHFLSIKARQIQDWADRLDARQHLPVLLRRLIHSTSLGLRSVNFPGHDNAERKGSDGVIESENASAWIPDGKSRWEFGVDKNPQAKARRDYAARVSSVPPTERSQSTFVFVTPRNWPGKEAWAIEKNAAKQWKAVRVIDANDLEQWIEESIPAQIWLAERLGLPTAGYQTLDDSWERWAAASDPPMTPELFAPSILAHAEAFNGWLAKDRHKPFVVAADSRGEALAFLACLFEKEDPEAKSKDLVAIFDSPDVLRTLAQSSSPFIAIVTTDETERELATIYRSHRSIVVRPRNAVNSQPDVVLDLLHHNSFGKALAAMNITGDTVERLARESGMSPTILRRRLSRIDAIRSPLWAEDSATARTLVPIMLVGAWNAKSIADTEILSVLGNRNYERIEEDITRLLRLDDPPVWSAGNYRGVASKIDLLFAIATLVTEKDLADFFLLSEYVLSEADPALDLPEDDRWTAGIYGKVRDHSAALREGICETLVILSVHGNNLLKDRLGIDVVGRVARLIADLLVPLTLDKLMSHDHDLPRYAEAAPDAVLSLIETDLKSSEPVVLGLLRPVSGGVFARCPRTGLLWALECLAWRPQNLTRVVAILATLSRTTIDDNWANKPIGSLEAIFRFWLPQTSASLEERCGALELLTKRYPDIGWQVCLRQFLSGPSVGSYSYRPHWRSDANAAGQGVDAQADAYSFVRKALDLALSWPSHDEVTLGGLVEHLHGMPEEDHVAVWDLIDEWAAAPTTLDSARASLRERVRRFALTPAGRHRIRNETMRERARATYAKLEPSDPVTRHGWLFANEWIRESADENDKDGVDLHTREERIHAQRSKAFHEVWSARGFDGVAALIANGGAASTVGRYAGLGVTDLAPRRDFLMRSLALDGDQKQKSEACIFGFLCCIDPDARQDLLRMLAEALSADQRVRLFTSSPFDAVTWQLVDGYGPELSARYWKEVFPQWNIGNSEAALNQLVQRLLDVQRPRAAFHAAQMNWQHIETLRLKRLMTDIATVVAEPEGTYRLDRHDISEALDALDGRPGITVNDMAQMEFLFVSALDHSRHGIPNLERQIAESPDLYMQAMALLWKRIDEGEDPASWRIADPLHRESVATAMYQVLQQMHRIPGTSADGTIVTSDLSNWLSQVRSLAAQHGRADITDHCLGQMLAKAPKGNTGVWPCPPVCDAMEKISSPEIGRGFGIGVHNSRGVHWRREGGEQERELAAKYREWSLKLVFDYPYVASILQEIAGSYDREAETQDSEARVSKRLRH